MVCAVRFGEFAVLGAEALAHLGVQVGAVDQLDLADALGLLGVVEQPDVGGDAGVVEHVGRQGDDGFDQVVLQQPAADLARAGLGAAGEERGAVEDDGCPAAAVVDGAHLGGEVLEEQHLAVADRRQPAGEPGVCAAVVVLG